MTLKPDPAEEPAALSWEPWWMFEEGLGACIDDGCMVFLVENEVGQWEPLTHIPPFMLRWAQQFMDRVE